MDPVQRGDDKHLGAVCGESRVMESYVQASLCAVFPPPLAIKHHYHSLQLDWRPLRHSVLFCIFYSCGSFKCCRIVGNRHFVELDKISGEKRKRRRRGSWISPSSPSPSSSSRCSSLCLPAVCYGQHHTHMHTYTQQAVWRWASLFSSSTANHHSWRGLSSYLSLWEEMSVLVQLFFRTTLHSSFPSTWF